MDHQLEMPEFVSMELEQVVESSECWDSKTGHVPTVTHSFQWWRTGVFGDFYLEP